jgi:hypothetical protein
VSSGGEGRIEVEDGFTIRYEVVGDGGGMPLLVLNGGSVQGTTTSSHSPISRSTVPSSSTTNSAAGARTSPTTAEQAVTGTHSVSLAGLVAAHG